MKFTGIIAAASMFVAGAMAQSNTTTFDLSTLNGTWHMAGLTDSLLVKIETIAQLYNMTVSCPQIYIIGNAPNVAYFQPSLNLGWFNRTSQQSQSANISLSGLMTLQTSAAANQAVFKVLLSVPSVAKGLAASHVKMLNSALSGGDSSNPLPHGADFQANLNVTLGSSKNDGKNDVVLVQASNFSGAPEQQQMQPVKCDSGVYTALLVNGANTLDANTFTTCTTAFGSDVDHLARLNDTCTVTQ